MSKDGKTGGKRGSANKNKIIYVIIAAVAVALVVGIVLMIALSPKGEEEKPANDTDTAPAETAPVPVETEEAQVVDEMPVEYLKHASNITISRVEGVKLSEFNNPLTGEPVDKDISGKRPAAIMINNIHVACPQVGVSDADVIYEALAEGGITRLLMVKQDYASLDVVGSIRSSRKYYIDFALNHDALYIHAGGSDEAYQQIVARSIDHIDGVNSDGRTGANLSGMCFYRDQERLATMAYEHSLMSTGEMIKSGIERMNYRTDLREGFKDPLNPVKYGYQVDLTGEDATYLKISYRPADEPEYEYDEATGTYLRFQYGHEKHIDGANGEQLSFANVIVLVMNHSNTGDAKGHINITTFGEGNGYYMTRGKIIPINWSCATADDALVLTDSSGYPLFLNPGKTFINIISPAIESTMVYR